MELLLKVCATVTKTQVTQVSASTTTVYVAIAQACDVCLSFCV